MDDVLDFEQELERLRYEIGAKLRHAIMWGDKDEQAEFADWRDQHPDDDERPEGDE